MPGMECLPLLRLSVDDKRLLQADFASQFVGNSFRCAQGRRALLALAAREFQNGLGTTEPPSQSPPEPAQHAVVSATTR